MARSLQCTGGSICVSNLCREHNDHSRRLHSIIAECPQDAALFRGRCLRTARGSGLATIYSHAPLFNARAGSGAVTLGNAADGDETALVEAAPANAIGDDADLKTVAPGAMCKLSLECPYKTDCIRGESRASRNHDHDYRRCRCVSLQTTRDDRERLLSSGSS